MHPTIAYKILTADQMRALEDDRFEGAPIDVADGYIHLSTAEQLAGTLDAHFAGREDLFLAAVDLSRAGTAVRWEASRGGALFPHLYGRLARALVLTTGPLRRTSGGAVALPGDSGGAAQR
ncbi:MAG: DUF952 domain-containing protein [Alphaproteobacteria bacterium]|nr:DUF952 domain-containing protein [Alphaproteobacteria bacterium]